jgi:hypothetical protein
MHTNRRTSSSTPTSTLQPRSLRRRILGLVLATGVVVTGLAAAAPVAAQAAPPHVAADTSTWG